MTETLHKPDVSLLLSNARDTQAAVLNVLSDYLDTANESYLLKRAVLNILEDLEASNLVLEEKSVALATVAEELLQKNAVDTAILQSIGDGIIVTDSKQTITFVNRAFEVLTGWTSHEALGKNIVDILPIEKDSLGANVQLQQIISRVLLGESYQSDNTKPFYNIRKNKTTFPAGATITPVWLHGSVIGLVKSFRDITKEIDIDTAKTEFVSLASHQLRTPLSAINWYTEMLLSGDVGPITEGQEKYLTEVYKGNQRMVRLVNALLNVTKMTLGTFILEPEMINVVTLINDVLTEQTPESVRKQLQISTIFEPNIPIIESDAKLLRMVVQNLIANAIKYTPPGGEIELSLCLNTDGTRFLFTVADSGIGIPKKQQQQIFTRLFRADNVRTQETEGTGLGLYIVKAITENSGGRVWFESEENQGSTFHVELPILATIR